MAWNRSESDQGIEVPKPARTGIGSSVVRGAVAGVASVAAVLAVLFFVFSGDKPVSKARAERKTGLIRDAGTVKKNPSEPAAVTNAVPQPTNNVHVVTPPAAVGQVMRLMDGTVITNKPVRMFDRPFEAALYASVRPGGFGATLLRTMRMRYDDEHILMMLKELTLPKEGDTPGTVRAKQQVQALKEEMLLAIRDGHSVSEVFDEMIGNSTSLCRLRAEAQRIRSEALRSDDKREAAKSMAKANDILVKQGVEPLPVPSSLQVAEDGDPDLGNSNDNNEKEAKE